MFHLSLRLFPSPDFSGSFGKFTNEQLLFLGFSPVYLQKRIFFYRIRFFYECTKGIKMDEKKINIIQNFPALSNIKEMRGFLGMINFSSNFTDRLAQETIPLVNLTKKGVK